MRLRTLPLALLLVMPTEASATIRTIPDPACASAYGGTSGVAGMPADPGLGKATDGGEAPPPEIAASLPARVVFRSNTETFNRTLEFVAAGGQIWARPIASVPDGEWRSVGLPQCLDGDVKTISADGDSLLATDSDGWLYTLTLAAASPGGAGWTRRWGPFFWTDFGMQIPSDVISWSASHLSAGEDGTFTDRAGNAHEPFGILNLYLLRGDGRTITTLDPWLPSDASREVCTPARNTSQIAAIAGSGSTVAIVDRAGVISTRLFEFDVAGSNTVFYDYAWEDQTGVESPRVQLPAPDWVTLPPVPGPITDRISMSKIFPAPTGRLLRVEGSDGNGDAGYWEADIADGVWSFVRTGDAPRGRALPLSPVGGFATEDLTYVGTADGWPAEVIDFNPYCSPAILRVRAGGDTLDLTLHSIDGLRQERRARGITTDPHGYRSAIEVPASMWASRGALSADARGFLEEWFSDSPFLDGPLVASESKLTIGVPCWTFARAGAPDDLVASSVYDMGAQFAGLMAAQEEDRAPSACTAAYGAP